MSRLRSLTTSELIDLMARKTTQYISKLTERHSVELEQYEYEIALIQGEINSRQQMHLPIQERNSP